MYYIVHHFFFAALNLNGNKTPAAQGPGKLALEDRPNGVMVVLKEAWAVEMEAGE